MKPRTPSARPKPRSGFDSERYLKSAGPARKVVKYPTGAVVFSQGDPASDVRYLQKGAIKVSVLSRLGKEAVVAMLEPGDFFGEGALISQETLAEMIGATRSRVNFFMNKFRKLGLIEYNGGLKINSSLLTVVLHD